MRTPDRSRPARGGFHRRNPTRPWGKAAPSARRCKEKRGTKAMYAYHAIADRDEQTRAVAASSKSARESGTNRASEPDVLMIPPSIGHRPGHGGTAVEME